MWGPLAPALLLLLLDNGDGAGDVAYQGPVLVKVDISILVDVQALDQLVRSLLLVPLSVSVWWRLSEAAF